MTVLTGARPAVVDVAKSSCFDDGHSQSLGARQISHREHQISVAAVLRPLQHSRYTIMRTDYNKIRDTNDRQFEILPSDSLKKKSPVVICFYRAVPRCLRQLIT